MNIVCGFVCLKVLVGMVNRLIFVCVVMVVVIFFMWVLLIWC